MVAGVMEEEGARWLAEEDWAEGGEGAAGGQLAFRDIEDAAALDGSAVKEELLRQLHGDLLRWYGPNRRAMPWRGDPPESRPITAYGVWVSEVMLQQTRVETVISYWNRWMDRFPDVSSLASASADEVNQLWAGLGYYRRAQNLRLGAQFVVERFGGAVPSSKADLLSIPGIGPYTAGAIASIAFSQPEAAVDGNVYRVFSRMFALVHPLASKGLDKACWGIGERLASVGEAGSFNQALMELGATVCKPLNPSCATCPVRAHCLATALPDGVSRFPVKAEKKTKVREVSLFVLVLRAAQPESALVDLTEDVTEPAPRFLLWRRPAKGLLANQWEFPAMETATRDVAALHSLVSARCGLAWPDSDCTGGRLCMRSLGLREITSPILHVFSHERHTMDVAVEDIELPAVKLELCEGEREDDGVRWMTGAEMERAGITSGCKKILKAVQALDREEAKRDRKRGGDAFAVLKAAQQQQRRSDAGPTPKKRPRASQSS